MRRAVAKDTQAIAEKIRAANSSITSHEFENIIYELRGRRILQGESTLYITPQGPSRFGCGHSGGRDIINYSILRILPETCPRN